MRMPISRRPHRRAAPLAAACTAGFSLALALALTLSLAPRTLRAAPTLTQVSTDPFTNTTSQHKTEAEPDSFSFGSTIVFAFQTGRFVDGGSSDIGWATSTDAGATWHSGFLPGITVYQGGGPFARVSDPAVAYDSFHHQWLISSLAINSSVDGQAVVVSHSTDGLHWSNPVTVADNGGSLFFDKDWIGCYSAPPPFNLLNKSLGHCYVEFDIASNSDRVQMSTSTDGGSTWSAYVPGAGGLGLAGEPVVQPNGNVVVPFLGDNGDIYSFRSTDGGKTWTNLTVVSPTSTAFDPANGYMRSGQLPSAAVDGAGNVYVVWEDCRFESGCSNTTPNDVVMTTSADGVTWTPVALVPIDPKGSGIDHFLPGIGADHATAGSSAHLAIFYYYFTNDACSFATCQLDAGYVSSTNGGSTWSAPVALDTGMSLSWFAQAGGVMVGDYTSVSYAGGHAFPIFAAATSGSGTQNLNQNMYTETGLSIAGGSAQASAAGAYSPVGPSLSRPIRRTAY